MQVTLDELSSLWIKLMDHLQELNIKAVELPQDYYWSTPFPEGYDVYGEPPQQTIGQLTEDWSNLNDVLKGNVQPVAYHFVPFAAILRAIGEKGEAELFKPTVSK